MENFDTNSPGLTKKTMFRLDSGDGRQKLILFPFFSFFEILDFPRILALGSDGLRLVELI